jgi:hypothetical protein
MRFRFLKTALFLTALMALALVYPLYAWASPAIIQAIIAAGIIAFVNIILGALSLEYAIDKSNGTFMTAVFGGMGVRMGLILVAMTLLLLNGFHALALALSLMGFYVVFMIAEITYATRELSQRSARARAPKRKGNENTSFRTLSVDHRSN